MILFLSNGAGEDAIAARIATHLHRLRPDLELAAFPLVGEGKSYPLWMERHGVVATSPSGGLSNESWRTLLHDIRSGLFSRLWIQGASLRRLRAKTQRLVAVGDLLTVLLGGLCGYRPVVFVGTAKSSYHHPYSRPEVWALRRWSGQVFPRDPLTAQHLAAAGVPASFEGNAMMDGLEPTGRVPLPRGEGAAAPQGFSHSAPQRGATGGVGVTRVPLPRGGGEASPEGAEGPGLAIFPGSRQATYRELPRLLEVYWGVRHLGVAGVVALADSIEIPRLARECRAWVLRELPGPGLLAQLERPGCQPVRLVRGALGDVLHACQVGLGQAGTAHEQAAGMGLPVVSLHPAGEPLGWYRGRQQGLLGEALWVVPPDQAVAALETLFGDSQERERRGAIGRERMGPSGGALRMAEWLAR